ncbi:hypothetical protein DICVIV_00023 [Dictyocaulus viviparus]|uniref:SCP domain-containing protein n=1 Tax=Dictyocaulus viviparus TaxID=29172 RepID=A0A0D8YA11_DICVI|nr:hypothetical protein DICVIV_00023 [Dictyocaulus viviparus]
MSPIFVFLVLALNVLLDAAPLPLVTNTKCSLSPRVKKIFKDFLRKHNFPTNWDCGLENLAKGELDRAESATTNFPLTEAASKYYTLTSKGMNIREALDRIPSLFLEDGKYLDRKARFGCNREKRKELVLACIIEPKHEKKVK